MVSGSANLAPHVLEVNAGRIRTSLLQKNIPYNTYVPLSGHFNQLDNHTMLQYTSLSAAEG